MHIPHILIFIELIVFGHASSVQKVHTTTMRGQTPIVTTTCLNVLCVQLVTTTTRLVASTWAAVLDVQQEDSTTKVVLLKITTTWLTVSLARKGGTTRRKDSDLADAKHVPREPTQVILEVTQWAAANTANQGGTALSKLRTTGTTAKNVLKVRTTRKLAPADIATLPQCV